MNEDKIVRIQATYRGHLTRQALKNGVGLMHKYGGNGSIKEEGEEDQDENEVVFKDEHVFDNGAVYRGQWLKDKRHGYGV